MCWNKEISLSTFVLACSALIIRYIINDFSWALCIFYLSIASMQLLEYFIWSYGLKNKQINYYLSVIGLFIILAQPAAAGLIIKESDIQSVYYLLYAAFVCLFLLVANPIRFETVVAKNGHLQWKWLNVPLFIVILWTLFPVMALYFSRTSFANFILRAAFIIIFVGISYYFYYRDGTWGSVYCSLINIMFVFIIAKAFYGQYSCLVK